MFDVDVYLVLFVCRSCVVCVSILCYLCVDLALFCVSMLCVCVCVDMFCVVFHNRLCGVMPAVQR